MTVAEKTMELADIKGTSLRISRVGLGTWAIGGWMWGGTDDAQSIATIRAALDHGINLIDTAPVYGFGHSEEIVGKALAERRPRAGRHRHQGRARMEGRQGRSATPAAPASCRRSRIRCAACRPTSSTSTRSTGPIPNARWRRPPRRCRAARAGKDPRHRRQQFLASAQMERSAPWRRSTSLQPPYNLFEREIEADILPYCHEARHRDARLWRALPRPARRPHDGRTPDSPATICAATIPSSSRRASRNISPRWSGWTGWRSDASASASSIWPCAGCSTRASPRALGRAPAGPARAGRRGRRLDARRRGEGRDRPDRRRRGHAIPVGPEFMAPPARA